MSQRNVFKSPITHHRSISRGKASMHVSPRNQLHETHRLVYEDSSLTPPKNNHFNQVTASENVLKNIQQPLEFSANRKAKSKHNNPLFPQPNNLIYPPPSAVFTISSNQSGSQNAKFSNQNQNHDAGIYTYSIKTDANEITKLRNYYQNQIRAFIEGHKNSQVEFEGKIKNMEKEKNYWRESYMKLKEQFQQHMRNNQEKKQKYRDRSKDKGKDMHEEYVFTLNKHTSQKNNNVALLQQNITNLQQQLQQNAKSLKVAQDQIYHLNKQKADLQYEINYLREQNRRANCKIFELQNQSDLKEKQIRQLKEKLEKNNEEFKMVSKSMDFRREENLTNSMNLQMSINNEMQSINQHTRSSPQRSHSSSGSRARSSSSSPSPISVTTSFSSKQKSSKHNPHNRGHRSHSEQYSSHVPQEMLPIHSINIFDSNKQFEKMKHNIRKLQKTLHSQNQQIMIQGIKKLNEKYMQQSQDSYIHLTKTKQTVPSAYDSKLSESNTYSFLSASNIYGSRIPRYS